MNNQFTPGPWQKGGKNTKDGGNELFVYCDNALGTAVCSLDLEFTHNIPNAEKIANAHLIASAPDLLEALASLIPFIEEHQDEGPAGYGWRSKDLIEKTEKAKAAINKALNK